MQKNLGKSEKERVEMLRYLRAFPQTLSKAAEVPANHLAIIRNEDLINIRLSERNVSFTLGHKVAAFSSDDETHFELLAKPDSILNQELRSKDSKLNGRNIKDEVARYGSENVTKMMVHLVALGNKTFEQQIPVLASRDIRDIQISIAKMPQEILVNRRKFTENVALSLLRSEYEEVREELSANKGALKIKFDSLTVNVGLKVIYGPDIANMQSYVPNTKSMNFGEVGQAVLKDYYVAHLLLTGYEVSQKIKDNIKNAGPEVLQLRNGDGYTVEEMEIKSDPNMAYYMHKSGESKYKM